MTQQTESQYMHLLDGIEGTRIFTISLGQSSGSKGVMFVLYSWPKPSGSPYAKEVYLGQLADDLDSAILKARERMGKLKLELWDEATVKARQKARKPHTFPFGKYKGQTVEQVYDQDAGYILWAAKNCSFKNQDMMELLAEYARQATELITENNRVNSMPALPVEDELTMKRLTIYRLIDQGSYFKHHLTDEHGNKYRYNGRQLGEKGEVVEVKARVAGSYESLGVTFNNLKLKKA